MTTQFIKNSKGEKTAVTIPINEYEDLLHKHHLNLDLTDEYKSMIDKMIEDENNGTATYVSYQKIKDKFRRK